MPESGKFRSVLSIILCILLCIPLVCCDKGDGTDTAVSAAPTEPEGTAVPGPAGAGAFEIRVDDPALSYDPATQTVRVPEWAAFTVSVEPKLMQTEVSFTIGDPAVVEDTELHAPPLFVFMARGEGSTVINFSYASVQTALTVVVEKAETEPAQTDAPVLDCEILVFSEGAEYDAASRTLTLKVGERADFSVEPTISAYREQLTYTVGDPSVLADNGQMYMTRFRFDAVTPGRTTVTVFAASEELCVMTVVVTGEEETQPPPTEYVRITGADRIALETDKNGKVKYSVFSLGYETNFTEASPTPRKVWESSDPSVLSVADSYVGTVVPQKAGQAAITLTLINGDRRVSGTVVVTVGYASSAASLTLPETPEILKKSEGLMPVLVNSYLAAFLKTEEFYALEMKPENVAKAKTMLGELPGLWQQALDDACLLGGVTDGVIAELERSLASDAVRSASSSSADNTEWAEALTRKFDSYRGANKIRQLADDMGTDCKKAYKALTMAQEIIKGEAVDDEFFWETCQIVAEATKTSCKVGVYTCATLSTLGVGAAAVGASGGAATAVQTVSTMKQIMDVGGITVGGVECLLEVGKEGSKIILGEDHEVTVGLMGTADDFSNVSFLWGLASYKGSDTVDRVLYLTDNALNLFFEHKIGSFSLDPETGEVEAKQTDVRDPAAALPEKPEKTPAQLTEEKKKIVETEKHDEKVKQLGIDEPEEIIRSFEEQLEEEWNRRYAMTANGLVFRVEWGGGWYYVDAAGRKCGEYVWLDQNGRFIRRCMYLEDKLNGWCEEYRDGKLSEKAYYVDDVMHGPCEEYLLSEGVPYLFRASTYVNGVLEGKDTYYYPDGKIKSVCNYTAGKRDGQYVSYDSDGRLQSDLCYRMGVPDGYWYRYFGYGSDVVSRTFYVGGEVMEVLYYAYTSYPDGYHLSEEIVRADSGLYYYKRLAADGFVLTEGNMTSHDPYSATRVGVWILRERAGSSVIERTQDYGN